MTVANKSHCCIVVFARFLYRKSFLIPSHSMQYFVAHKHTAHTPPVFAVSMIIVWPRFAGVTFEIAQEELCRIIDGHATVNETPFVLRK